MKQTNSYVLENTGDSFTCPSIVSNTGSVLLDVDINPNYYDYGLCKCLPGFFGFGNRCLLCPSECDCKDGVSLGKCYSTPNVLDIVEIVPCMNPSVCSFTIKDSMESRMLISDGLYEFSCTKGYAGRDCSYCEDGYIFESGECNECSSDYSFIKVIAFVALLIIGAIYQVVMAWIEESLDDAKEINKEKEQEEENEEEHESASLDIFLFYTQVLQVLGNVVFIPFINSISRFISNLFSLRIPSLECMVGNHPHITSLLNLARIPIIISVGLLFLGKVLAKKDEKNIVKVVVVMFTFLEATYFSVVQDVISAFGCTLHDRGINSWFLNAYPWIQCNPTTDSYTKILFSTIPGFIYMILYPSFLWFLVLKSRKMRQNEIEQKNSAVIGNETKNIEMKIPEDMSGEKEGHKVDLKQIDEKGEHMSSAGNKRGNNGSSDTKHGTLTQSPKGNLDLTLPTFQIISQIQINRFSAIYEEEYDWWVVVRVSQSILFSLTAFVVPYTLPAILYFVFFVLIQFSLTIQNRFRPYILESDDHFSTNCWLLLYVSFFAALVQKLVPGNDWIAFVIMGLNSIFIAVFVIPYAWEIIQPIFGLLSRGFKNFQEKKIAHIKEKMDAYKEKFHNIIINNSD